jgi:hypothetical protein
MDGVEALVGRWREQAREMKHWGDERGSVLLSHAADELARAAARSGQEVLRLGEAAVICGYSAPSIGRMIREGRIPNAGRAHAPRVRRGDLPPRRGATPETTYAPRRVTAPREQIARSIVNRQ